MTGSEFEYVLDVYSMDNLLLQRSRILPDWLPVIEAARLESLKNGRPVTTAEWVAPSFHARFGPPQVCGVRAIAVADDGLETAVDLPLTCFYEYAQGAAQELVAAGKLAAGERFLYSVRAYSVSIDAPLDRFSVERVNRSPVHGMRHIAELKQDAEYKLGVGDQPFPVFVPQSVLDAAGELKDAAGDLEVGGLLYGYLWQDPESRIPFVEVTTLVPAEHTVASSAQLTFTADTWDSARAVIAERGLGEQLVAWVHTHPLRYWQPEKSADSPTNAGSIQFFSSQDCHLHRAVFSAAHHVAIVLGDRQTADGGWETAYTAYGWNNGIIETRAFSVIREREVACVAREGVLS